MTNVGMPMKLMAVENWQVRKQTRGTRVFVIKQEDAKSLTRCVIIDRLDGMDVLKESFRTNFVEYMW